MPRRRAFLRLTAGLIGGGGGVLLAACSPSPAQAPVPSAAPTRSPQPTVAATAAALAPTTGPTPALTAPPAAAAAPTPSQSAGLALPTYAPIAAVKADLPGTDVIPDGYLQFPAATFRSVNETPGTGSDVTWMTYNIVPNAALDDNPAWQAVNTRVGANLKMQLTPFADYAARLQTVLAGNDLPDVVFVQGIQPEQARLMEAKFADLTPYLSGDSVKDYPNLANLPTIAWKSTLFNNAIYAVPTAYMRFFWMLWARQEMLEAVGTSMPTTADDFKRVLLQLTRPQDGVWGIGSHTGALTVPYDLLSASGGLYSSMFGAPNQWRETGGKFTRTWETDQFKNALAYTRDLVAAGVYHPDSLNYNVLSKRTNFQAGKFAFEYDGMTIDLWNGARQINPATKLRQPLPPPGDGSKGHYWYGSGSFGITAIKKTSPERIKEILRIMNFLAAPIGSEEYLLLHYGVKDVDYTLDESGTPTLTDKGKGDAMPWGAGTVTVPNPPQILYDPQSPDFATVIQGEQKVMATVGESDPTIGLYSATNANRGNQLTQTLVDGLTEILLGNQPVSSVDGLVADWRKNGGDQTRAEYEQAFAAAQA
jgi:putative aldouronate transport system substrate-binding protein